VADGGSHWIGGGRLGGGVRPQEGNIGVRDEVVDFLGGGIRGHDDCWRCGEGGGGEIGIVHERDMRYVIETCREVELPSTLAQARHYINSALSATGWDKEEDLGSQIGRSRGTGRLRGVVLSSSVCLCRPRRLHG
jgi:hypothetical protein